MIVGERRNKSINDANHHMGECCNEDSLLALLRISKREEVKLIVIMFDEKRNETKFQCAH